MMFVGAIALPVKGLDLTGILICKMIFRKIHTT